MPKFFIAPTILRMLSEGRIFKVIFSWLLKIWSVAVVIGGLWISIELWRGTASSNQVVFGQLVFQAALVVALYLVAHLNWLRAEEIAGLPQTGADVIVPLTRLLLRLGGEVYASFMAVLCAGGALSLWISAGEFRMRSPQLTGFLPATAGEAFPAGLTLLVTGLVLGALGLLFGYLLSELLGLFHAIETNTRKGSKA